MGDVTTPDDTRPGADRILTIPNLLSFVRLLGIPVFLYLILVVHADGWALAILFLSGFTDWADGKLARLLDQASRLGALLDPMVDRLYIVTTLIALVARDVIPWWIAAILIGRELVLAPTSPCTGVAACPHRCALPGQGRDVPPHVRTAVAAAGPGGPHNVRRRAPTRLGGTDLGVGTLRLDRIALPGSGRMDRPCRIPERGAARRVSRRWEQITRNPVPSLLKSLLEDHLDPGYAAQPRTGQRVARSRRRHAPGSGSSSEASSPVLFSASPTPRTPIVNRAQIRRAPRSSIPSEPATNATPHSSPDATS